MPPAPEKKKRGRKPGLLLKKTLANQKRKITRANRANALLVTKDNYDDEKDKENVRDRHKVMDANDKEIKSEHIDMSSDNVFVEPALAPPVPGYLGFPLEALPPARPAGRARKLRRVTPPPPDASVEAAYRAKLATSRSESLTTRSEERTRVAPLTKRRKTPSRRSPSTPTHVRVKRLKITMLRKPGFLKEAAPPADVTDNDDFCSTCGGTGVFICCELCPRLFHLMCCEPPLRAVPEDSWSCNECRAAQGMVARRLWNEIGVFGPLMNAMHGRNPAEFRLPKRLRDATFEGVATGADHAYTDTLVKPDIPYKKLHGGQLAGYNRNDDLDIDGLYDKNGVPYMCHRCGLLGLGHRTLVACDYCPLHWHLDCLREPVTLAKTLGLKWRCPNHVEALMPQGWDSRAFRDTVVVDAALHAHFLAIVRASNFVVKHSDQPYLADSRQPLLHEYMAYERNDFISNTSSFVDRRGWLDLDLDLDTDANFRVPEFLQNYATDGRVVAKASRRLGRILLMTNADDPDQRPFIYRVPEQLVLLDFLLTRSKGKILGDIHEYEARAARESADDALAALGLAQLHARPRLNFDELVAVALAADGNGNVSNGIVENRSVCNGESGVNGAEHSDDVDDLRQIKRLMELKGRDALLAFLRS